jgi:hypothetical protein
MLIGKEEMVKSVIDSLTIDSDSWEFDPSKCQLINKEYDCAVWIANGPSHITIYKDIDRTKPWNKFRKQIQPSYSDCITIYFLYRKIKDSSLRVKIIRSLYFITLFPFLFNGIIHNNYNSSNVCDGTFVEQIDFKMKKNRFREERLKKLLSIEK